MEEFFEFIIGLIVVVAVDVAIGLAAAQIAVFGLSEMHVNTGLLGPWLLGVAIGIIVSANTHKSKS